MECFPRGKPPDPCTYSLHLHFLSVPQYEFHSDGHANRKFFQAIAKFLEYFLFHISIHKWHSYSSLFLLESLVNLCIYAVLVYPMIIII